MYSVYERSNRLCRHIEHINMIFNFFFPLWHAWEFCVIFLPSERSLFYIHIRHRVFFAFHFFFLFLHIHTSASASQAIDSVIRWYFLYVHIPSFRSVWCVWKKKHQCQSHVKRTWWKFHKSTQHKQPITRINMCNVFVALLLFTALCSFSKYSSFLWANVVNIF